MFGLLLSEWRLPMFGTTGADENTINLKETFNPSPKIPWIVTKVAVLALNTFAVINSILMEEPSKAFWLSHLTHLTTLISTVYLISSFLSLVLFPIESGAKDVSTNSKVTWGLFSLSINLQLFVTILFWVLVYDSSEKLVFKTIYEHGILLLLVALDGFVIHRFPIRFKQIAWVYFVEISFVIWTGFHAISDIGNPTKSDNDPETDDDAIYSSLNWNQRPKGSAILVAILLCVGVPIMFLVLWSISMCIPKHYDAHEEPKEEVVEPKEEVV